jgi:hypothetical protein
LQIVTHIPRIAMIFPQFDDRYNIADRQVRSGG